MFIELVFKKLENSILKELFVEINYYVGCKVKLKYRIINLYGIVYWNNNWYVVVFCNMRNEVCSFRVDRISEIIEILNIFNRLIEFLVSEFFIKGIIFEIKDE